MLHRVKKLPNFSCSIAVRRPSYCW